MQRFYKTYLRFVVRVPRNNNNTITFLQKKVAAYEHVATFLLTTFSLTTIMQERIIDTSDLPITVLKKKSGYETLSMDDDNGLISCLPG
jgi:hypothetical protein